MAVVASLVMRRFRHPVNEEGGISLFSVGLRTFARHFCASQPLFQVIFFCLSAAAVAASQRVTLISRVDESFLFSGLHIILPLFLL